MARSRLGVRCGLGSALFSLVRSLPSAISFGPPMPSFDRFIATMPLCDSLSPCMWDPLLTAHGWQQGLSVLVPEVSMHAWGLRLRRACDALAISRAPQYCLPVRPTPSASLVLAISELIYFRDTQPPCAPSQRFKCSLTAALTCLGVRMVRYSFPA
ncbi:exported hypothetical protein [Candidatus Sulfopaludibacter sp. SbA3]|nr:exported hypothetical protein [Candidatus Sulfopaludibacter sp. SbA3]